MSLSVTEFPLDSKLIEALQKSQFFEFQDFEGFDEQQLSEVTKQSIDTCADILSEVRQISFGVDDVKTCDVLLKEELLSRAITSFNKDLDNLLDGGFPMGKVVEICGEASCGKTQLCMQLCVNVQIPEIMGGIEGEAVLLDCEDFSGSRFNEIATLTVNELREKFIENLNVNHSFLASFTSKTLTDGLSVLKCKSWQELRDAILRQLDSFLEFRPKVKLIIIDSISYLFRYDYEIRSDKFDEDIFERTKILLEVSQKLKEIATNKNICVIFTNHLTHRVDVRQDIPALGASFSHCSNIRLLLERDNISNLRYVSSTKNFPQKGKCEYTISALGFR